MLQPRQPLSRFPSSCRTCSRYFSVSHALPYAEVLESQRALPPSSRPDGSVPATNSRDSMAQILRRYKPRTPGLRHLVRPINDHLWRGRPIDRLTIPKKGQGKGGRNHTGHITVRHRGGGHKRRIRTVDFHRNEPGIHVVERIEYDPNRSAHIALVRRKENDKLTYILAPEGMREGDEIQSYRSGIPQVLMDSMGGKIDIGILASKTAWRGNCLQLGIIPVGTQIFNITIRPKGPGVYCRSAGTYGVVVGKGEDAVVKELAKLTTTASGEERKEEDMTQFERETVGKMRKQMEYVTVKLSSGEVRNMPKDCCATVGVASNMNHQYRQLGKAGRKRWLGWRPTVRGVAMNAVDHPHGGGRGKGKGNRDPVSPWGKPVCSDISEYLGFRLLMFYRPNLVSKPGIRAKWTSSLLRLGRGTRGSAGGVMRRRSVFRYTLRPYSCEKSLAHDFSLAKADQELPDPREPCP